MECLMKSSPFKDMLNKTWIPKSAEENRGFKDFKVGDKTVTAKEQSCRVEDMLELMTSYMPFIAAQVIIFEARSFNWIHDFLLKLYGYKKPEEVMTARSAQTHPKEAGNTSGTNNKSPPTGYRPQKDSLISCERYNSETKHHGQESTARMVRHQDEESTKGVTLPPRPHRVRMI